tara:strand:- start:41 stop:409 length:369 start_codon:yes stop_codon:yes gene_type:complete
MVALKVFLDFTEHLVDLLNEAGEQLAPGAKGFARELSIIHSLFQFGDVIIHAALTLVARGGDLVELGAHLAGVGHKVSRVMVHNVFFLFAQHYEQTRVLEHFGAKRIYEVVKNGIFIGVRGS